MIFDLTPDVRQRKREEGKAGGRRLGLPIGPWKTELGLSFFFLFDPYLIQHHFLPTFMLILFNLHNIYKKNKNTSKI